MDFRIDNGKRPLIWQHGFTFIELVMVMAMIALLVSVALPRYFEGQVRAKEAVLLDDLKTMRTAIEHYYADKSAYPTTLDELVEQRYLRFIPEDPITEQTDTWVVVPPPDLYNQVYDVQSGSAEVASNGTPYNSW